MTCSRWHHKSHLFQCICFSGFRQMGVLFPLFICICNSSPAALYYLIICFLKLRLSNRRAGLQLQILIKLPRNKLVCRMWIQMRFAIENLHFMLLYCLLQIQTCCFSGVYTAGGTNSSRTETCVTYVHEFQHHQP